MDYSQIVINGFWATMEGLTPLLVPFIAVVLVLRFVSSLILDKR